MNRGRVAFRLPNTVVPYNLEGPVGKNFSADEGFVFAPFPEGADNAIIIRGLATVSESAFEPNWFCTGEVLYDVLSSESIQNAIESVLLAIRTGQVKKVVLSTDFFFEWDKPPASADVFDRLHKAFPAALVWMADLPGAGLMAGATPELLIRQSTIGYKTVALAGTRVKGASWKTKEMEEQFMVKDELVNSLKRANATDITVDEPEDMEYGLLRHLSSDIRFGSANWQQVVDAIYPSAAICGVPRKAALDMIGRFERRPRGWYSGFLGLINAQGQPELYVNLRFARLYKNGAVITAGAGITADSDVLSELTEMKRKAQTVFSAICGSKI